MQYTGSVSHTQKTMASPTPSDRDVLNLADAFFAPSILPYDPRERDVIDQADELAPIEVTDAVIPVYRWGKGRPVLLVHGWGARAAHLGAYALAIAEAGFAAYAFDGPGHRAPSPGSPDDGRGIRRTTVLEFGAVIATLADRVGPLYGLVGHSFGGTAAGLAAAGMGRAAVACDRLALVSAPDRVSYMVAAWAHGAGLDRERTERLGAEVERRVGQSLTHLSVSAHAGVLPGRTLLLHDADDAEVPLSEAERVDRALGGGHLVVTRQLGHRRTLRSGDALGPLVAFLTAE